jgi:FAD:protein FMN transferase
MAVERAQPWLGTLVTIRAGGPDEGRVHEAITKAFAEIGTVHRLMSFHSPQSDVTKLNCAAFEQPVEIHPFTQEVLGQALALSAESDGCFDITVGAELVRSGFLPGSAEASRQLDSKWSDVVLLGDGRVVFRRPLWIDLGGIAKGYAVDRAIACLQKHGVTQAAVNAGGDLRVYGPEPELVALRVDSDRWGDAAMEISDGSAASSSGYLSRRSYGGDMAGPHLDGTTRRTAPTERFVCVVAMDCMLADALTKVVLVRGAASASFLDRFGAAAHVYDFGSGWMHLNEKCVQ